MCHIPIFLSFSECEQAPFCSQGLVSQPSGYSPNTTSLLILQKWENSSMVLHQLPPLWQSDWTLSVAGSVFTARQLHPAGCVVGAPSVVWELCLQDTTLPGGFYSLQHCYLAAIPAPYAFDLIQILNQKIMEISPACVANHSFCAFCFVCSCSLSHLLSLLWSLSCLYVQINPACRD